MKSRLLSNPSLYHYLRQILTGGMPFDDWVRLYGFNDPSRRIADLGCGPADMLRFLGDGRRPEFYLGVDISQPYLDAARARADRAEVDSEFVRMDLDRLPSDPEVQAELTELLETRGVTRVLLLGVIHHIPDDSARTTLNLAHGVRSVSDLFTSDVVYVPDQRLNNVLCDWDRGEYVRDEHAYDTLAASSAWPFFEKTFTLPRFSFIKYLHYRLSKQRADVDG